MHSGNFCHPKCTRSDCLVSERCLGNTTLVVSCVLCSKDLNTLLSFQFMASGEVSLVPLIVLKPIASRLKLIFVSFFKLEVRGLQLSFPFCSD